MEKILEKYGYTPSLENIDKVLTSVQNNLDNWVTPANLASCLGYMDLTTLNSVDTYTKVANFTKKSE